MKTQENFNSIVQSCNYGNWSEAVEFCVECAFTVAELVEFNSKPEAPIRFDSPYDIAQLMQMIGDYHRDTMVAEVDKISLKLKELESKDKTLEDVKEFDKLMNDVAPTEIDFTNSEMVLSRITLIVEELFELIEACGYGNNLDLMDYIVRKIPDDLTNRIGSANPIEALDALVDLRYVCDFMTNGIGLSDKFVKAFNIIHRNNMTKICHSMEEVRQTMRKYHKENGTICKYEERELRGEKVYVVLCERDPNNKIKKGKVLKPAGYEKVDLKTLF